MNKKETAAKFHSTGCNCAQAVACAFCDEADTDAMKSLTRRYGGGAYKYCGALMGAVAISFGVFALLYAVVYRVTSNAYYNIVS